MQHPFVDADDVAFTKSTWLDIEQELARRDQVLAATAGVDTEPQKPPGQIFNTFPWEEVVEDFAKPASCTQSSWKHSALLKYTIGGSTATLTLAKGQNSMDPAMVDALQDAVMDLKSQTGVRLIVLKAEGKLFTNGVDPKHLVAESGEEKIRAFHLQLAKVLYFFSKLPQWKVALVQGSAMGAGVGLICACDLVVSVKGAFFSVLEGKLGLSVATFAPYLMNRAKSAEGVKGMVLLGDTPNAESAKELGLVDEVVDDEAGLAAELKACADKLTACAPGAVALTKSVVDNTSGSAPSSFLLNYVAGMAVQATHSAEFQQGVAALQAKKRPAWGTTPIAV